MDFKYHRYDPATKMMIVFNVERCENCKGEVVSPNALSMTVASARKLGTTDYRIPYAEIVPTNHGWNACTVCEPNG